MDHESLITYGCFHPDFTEEMNYFYDNKVYTVQIESNLTCGQGCRYCYASSADVPMKELPAKNIMDILDSAARMEVRAVDWLGGDPILRKDWYELMKYAIGKGLKNNIWTSGMPLENIEVARKAVEVTQGGFISVHLDTLDEDLYGKLHTGEPKKKIRLILDGIRNVQALGKEPDTMINCITFNKLVAGEDVKKTTRYFFEHFGMRTCLTQMCKAGLARKHADWIPAIRDIQEACEVRDEVNYAGSRLSMSTMDANKFYCGGIVCVTIDGDLTPCSVIRKGFGNIHDTSFEQAVKHHRDDLLFITLRDPDNLPGHCSSCDHNSVCWGCRATAFYEKGDIMAEDPRCWMNPMNSPDR